MNDASTTQAVFVSTREARLRLGVTRDQLGSLIRRNVLTTRRLPGLHPRVLLSDVERLAGESLRPAMRDREA